MPITSEIIILTSVNKIIKYVSPFPSISISDVNVEVIDGKTILLSIKIEAKSHIRNMANIPIDSNIYFLLLFCKVERFINSST